MWIEVNSLDGDLYCDVVLVKAENIDEARKKAERYCEEHGFRHVRLYPWTEENRKSFGSMIEICEAYGKII